MATAPSLASCDPSSDLPPLESLIDNLWHYGSSAMPSQPNLPASRKALLSAMQEGFSRQEVEELRRVFNLLDENHDGQLSSPELMQWLRRLGLEVSDSDLIRIVKGWDRNNDGALDLSEFLCLERDMSEEDEDGHGSRGEKRHLKTEVEEAFDLFDRDGDGLISPTDLAATLARMGLMQSSRMEHLQSMIKRADADGDGEVSLAEFEHMLAMSGPKHG